MNAETPITKAQCQALKVVAIKEMIKRVDAKARVTNLKKSDLCDLLINIKSKEKKQSSKPSSSTNGSGEQSPKKKESPKKKKAVRTKKVGFKGVGKSGSPVKSKSTSPVKSTSSSPVKSKSASPTSPKSSTSPKKPDVCKYSDPDMKQTLVYSNNSCYLDTLLTMLLTSPGLRNTLKPHLLNAEIEINTGHQHTDNELEGLQRTAEFIKTELNRISQYFDGQNVMESRTLRTIRRLLNRFYRIANGHQNEDFEVEQIDPFDVLSLFSQMFKMPQDVLTDNGPSMFHNVSKIITPFNDGVHTGKYVPEYVHDDITNADEKESHNDDRHVFAANELLVSVERAKIIVSRQGKREAKTVKVIDEVIPDQVVSLKGQSGKLNLSAVIIHLSNGYTNGHYTLMIRHGDAWYYYDDLAGPLFTCIGTYDDMINYSIKKGSTKYPKIALKYSKAILYTKDF